MAEASLTLSSSSTKAVIASVIENEEDLSDAQVQELLQQAEIRLLKNKSEPTATSTANRSSRRTYPKLDIGTISQPYIKSHGGICRVDSSYLLEPSVRDLANQPTRKVTSLSVEKKRLAEEKKSTAGPEWFHLPRTNLSDKLKTDLKLLGMRAVLDPKRHYRKEKFNPDGPKFSQVGTIIEGPTEFFSARLRNKERKQTIVEEVMAGEAETGRFKREYLKRQVAKTSGRRKFYRELKAKRFRQRK